MGLQVRFAAQDGQRGGCQLNYLNMYMNGPPEGGPSRCTALHDNSIVRERLLGLGDHREKNLVSRNHSAMHMAPRSVVSISSIVIGRPLKNVSR